MKLSKPVYAALTVICLVLLIFSCSKSNNNNNAGSNNNNNNNSGNTITITGMTFPATFTVKKGTTVTWKNNSSMPHTATSDDNGATFDTGNIPAGGTGSFAPSVTGTINYHCKFHPGMTGKLVVTD